MLGDPGRDVGRVDVVRIVEVRRAQQAFDSAGRIGRRRAVPKRVAENVGQDAPVREKTDRQVGVALVLP